MNKTETDQAARNRRNWWLAGVGLLGLLFAWKIRTVLNPLVLAYILAFIAHPFVLRLEKRGWGRMGAVNLIYAICGVCGLVLLLGFGSQGASLFGKVLRQAQDQEGGLFVNLDRRFTRFVEKHEDKAWMGWLVDEESAGDGDELDDQADGEPDAQSGTPPDAAESNAKSPKENAGVPPPNGVEPGATAQDPSSGDGAIVAGTIDPPGESGQEAPTAGELDAHPGASGIDLDPDDGASVHLIPAMQRLWNQVILEMNPTLAGTAAKRGVGVVTSWFGSIFGLLSMLVLLPIYTWFLLFELEHIHKFIRRHLPVQSRERYSGVARKVGEVLSSFLRGQLMVCLLKGLFITIALKFAGMPYALFLGLTAGFLAVIPFFGASFAAVFTFLIALMDLDFLQALWRVGLIFGIAELLEGYVFVPRIIGGSLGLHPLAVLIAVLAGGAALGMFGFLIALPLVATIVILLREFVLPDLKEWADESKIVKAPLQD